jgi:hypothetical protein
MTVIKQDAALLSQESDLISAVQETGELDCELDDYVGKLEDICKEKVKLYQNLGRRVGRLK